MKKIQFWLWFAPSIPLLIIAGLLGLTVGYIVGYTVWLAEKFQWAFMQGYHDGREQTEYPPHETSPRRSRGLF